MTIILTPLCYAYLAGSIILFSVWLVFFLVRKDLRKEMLTMSVLIGVLSVVTGYFCGRLIGGDHPPSPER